MLFACALLLATPQISGDGSQWIERLQIPRIVNVDFEFTTNTGELGLQGGYSLSMPKDPRVAGKEASDRLAAGERTSKVLHQMSWAMAEVRQQEGFQDILNACLNEYKNEITAKPDDFDLRMRYGKALGLAFSVSGNENIYGESINQYDAAAILNPRDWRARAEQAHITLLMFQISKNHEAKWLDQAIERARASMRATPTSPAPKWLRFNIEYIKASALLADAERVEILRAVEQLALQFEEDLKGTKGADRARLAASGFWFMCRLGVWIEHGFGQDSKLPATPNDTPGGMVERLELVRVLLTKAAAERAPDAPRDTFLIKVARVYWLAYLVYGNLDQREERLADVLAAGVAREDALTLALMATHRRKEAEVSATYVDQLRAAIERDRGWAALALYHSDCENGEAALEAIGQCTDEAAPLILLRAVLALRWGNAQGQKTVLAELAAKSEAGKNPHHGELMHAYGVALALDGQYTEARKALLAAAVDLKDAAGALATMKEVRALIDAKDREGAGGK